MKSRLAWSLGAALTFALGACANSRPAEGSSETHFLLLCSDDSCGGGLSCVCGVCTKPCSSDSMCSSLGDGVRCYSVGHQACDSAERCDVECTQDADCKAISDNHVCDGGRCRAPEAGEPAVDPGIPVGGSGGSSGGGGNPPSGDSCGLSAMVARLADGAQLMECGQLGLDATRAERADAVACMGNAWESKTPFRLTWAVQGTDSALESGYAGVLSGDEVVVYSFSYDSAGTAPDGHVSAWAPCALLRVPESCADPAQCVTCEQRTAQQCTCRVDPDQSTQFDCRSSVDDASGSALPEITADFVPPCAPTRCELDGICYPDGAVTEDGCCFCDNGVGGCEHRAECPGSVSIGKRCASDADCSQSNATPGLFCRTDFFGERGVCTRDCNFGCPTGFECVADIPDYETGNVHNVCMRACRADADCATDSRGMPLGSECDMPPGLEKSYCF